jgi:hypothetical protein
MRSSLQTGSKKVWPWKKQHYVMPSIAHLLSVCNGLLNGGRTNAFALIHNLPAGRISLSGGQIKNSPLSEDDKGDGQHAQMPR